MVKIATTDRVNEESYSVKYSDKRQIIKFRGQKVGVKRKMCRQNVDVKFRKQKFGVKWLKVKNRGQKFEVKMGEVKIKIQVRKKKIKCEVKNRSQKDRVKNRHCTKTEEIRIDKSMRVEKVSKNRQQIIKQKLKIAENSAQKIARIELILQVRKTKVSHGWRSDGWCERVAAATIQTSDSYTATREAVEAARSDQDCLATNTRPPRTTMRRSDGYAGQSRLTAGDTERQLEKKREGGRRFTPAGLVWIRQSETEMWTKKEMKDEKQKLKMIRKERVRRILSDQRREKALKKETATVRLLKLKTVRKRLIRRSARLTDFVYSDELLEFPEEMLTGESIQTVEISLVKDSDDEREDNNVDVESGKNSEEERKDDAAK